jgi:hypothetical protein
MALLLLIADEQNQHALRRERIFRDRVNPLDIYDDVDLIKRYRMPRHVLLRGDRHDRTGFGTPNQKESCHAGASASSVRYTLFCKRALSSG